MLGGNKQIQNNELQIMILTGVTPLSRKGNNILLQRKMVPWL